MRLATFNILNGRSLADGRVDVDRLAGAVERLDADILGLQEVDRGQERSGRADLTAVAAEAMGAVDHRFVAALSGTPGATWTAATGEEQPDAAAYGVALLCRYPVRSWEVVRLPAARFPAPVLAAGTRRPLLVRDEPRVAVCAVVESPLGPVTVATTHLSFVRGWNVLQLRRAMRALSVTALPRVLMGDLHMGLRTATRVTGMRAAARELTFPAGSPTRQLDHVLVEGLEGRPVARALELDLSDHRALVVDV
jgi:endonuclease/exonuclease/phosphatase family metal-dependent hydrolase